MSGGEGGLINMPLLLRILFRIDTQRCNAEELAEDAGVHKTTVLRQISAARRWLGLDIRYDAKHRMYNVVDWGCLKRDPVMRAAVEANR